MLQVIHTDNNNNRPTSNTLPVSHNNSSTTNSCSSGTGTGTSIDVLASGNGDGDDRCVPPRDIYNTSNTNSSSIHSTSMVVDDNDSDSSSETEYVMKDSPAVLLDSTLSQWDDTHELRDHVPSLILIGTVRNNTNHDNDDGSSLSVPVRVLIDSGAESTLVCDSVVRQCNLYHMKSNVPREAVSAFNERELLDTTAVVPLTLQEYNCNLHMLVVPNLTHYQVILGKNWLTHVNAVEHHVQRSIICEDSKGRKITLREDNSVIQQLRSEVLMSSVAVRRLLSSKKRSKDIDMYVVKIRSVNTTYHNDNNNNTTNSSNTDTDNTDNRFGKSIHDMIVHDYSDVCGDLPPGLPPNRSNDHTIVVEQGIQPIHKPPNRISKQHDDEALKQINELLGMGFIRPSKSSWASPILFVKKKDGKWRMCVDYRGLNNVTIKNRYPLPNAQDLLDRLTHAVWLSKLDLASGYHQVRVADDSIDKTAFITSHGLYEYLVMPFGLCNAPSTFMQLMNDTLKPLIHKCVIVYLDDILIYSTTKQQHIQDVRSVFDILRSSRLYVKPSKCEFGSTELEFLGHIVGHGCMKMSPQKVSAIQEWPIPTNVTEIRSFLGLATYYRRFVRDFSSIAAPMYELTKDSIPFVWGMEQQKSFDTLKQCIISSPIIRLPDFNKDWIMYTDASGYGVGGVLCQEYDGIHHPILFMSHKLGKHEMNWPTHEKELYAIVLMFKVCRHYVQGKHVTVYTDHRALEYIITQPNLTPKQARWSAFMCDYDWKIVYKEGKYNQVADALSRRSDMKPNDDDTLEHHDYRFGMDITHIRLVHILGASTITADNEFIQRVKDTYKDDESCSRLLTMNGNSEFNIKDGLIYKGEHRLYIPDANSLKLPLVGEYHDNRLLCHRGIDKTYDLLSRYYYWPHMIDTVKEYIRTCYTCQANKVSNHKPSGLLMQRPIPRQIFTEITLDFITSLPKTNHGNTCILVVVDRLSKWVLCIPYGDISYTASYRTAVEQTADILWKHWILIYGIPHVIISDRDRQFDSELWINLFKSCGTQLLRSSAYHPETDGQTERTNRTIKEILRSYCNDQQNDWDDYIPYVMSALNNTVQTSTGRTPSEVVYGRRIDLPADIAALHNRNNNNGDTTNDNNNSNSTITVSRWVESRQDILNSVYKHLAKTMSQQKVQADKHRRYIVYNVGQYVWLSTDHVHEPASRSSSLKHKYAGPYKIIEKINDNAYRLELPPNSKVHNVFNISRLRRFYPRLIDIVDDDGNKLPPPPDIIDDNEEFEVEKILDKRKVRNNTQYLVKWASYDHSWISWEPVNNLINAKDAIQDYERWKAGKEAVGKVDDILKDFYGTTKEITNNNNIRQRRRNVRLSSSSSGSSSGTSPIYVVPSMIGMINLY